jgi:hypothetical protein
MGYEKVESSLVTTNQVIVKDSKEPWVHIAVLSMGASRDEQKQWIDTTLERLRKGLIGMVADDVQREGKFRVTRSYSRATPVMNNRAKIVKQFRAMGADYLLMLDEDCVPHKNLFDLVELDLDIVGFPAPLWRGVSYPKEPMVWNVELIDATGERLSDYLVKDGPPQEVARIGTGGMLIAKRVFQRIKAPFVEPVDAFGERIVGGDLYFCDQARQAGFKVWAAPSYLLSHLKVVDLYTMWDLLHPDTDRLEPTIDRDGPWDLEGWDDE